MAYFSHELFDDAGQSRGWFVFYPDGTIYSNHASSTQADSLVGSLNRDERAPPSVIDENPTTVELYDREGYHVGSADFDKRGKFIPGTHKPRPRQNASASETTKPRM